MLISAEIDSSLFCQGLGGVAVSFLLRCAVRTMPVRVCRDMCGMMGLDFRAFFFFSTIDYTYPIRFGGPFTMQCIYINWFILGVHACICDWASHAFLPMIPCKGCSLAKIQHHSLSSLIRVPRHHFTYDTVLRDSHCERPMSRFKNHAIPKRRMQKAWLLLITLTGVLIKESIKWNATYFFRLRL
jgi:hypothetical protein